MLSQTLCATLCVSCHFSRPLISKTYQLPRKCSRHCAQATKCLLSRVKRTSRTSQKKHSADSDPRRASSSQASVLNWSFRGGGCTRRLRIFFCAVLTIVFHLFRLHMMLNMTDFMTMRCTRMNTMFLHVLVWRFGDLIGSHRLRCRRIRRAGDAGCECWRSQHGGRDQNGRD